jgi:hypothetical protein
MVVYQTLGLLYDYEHMDAYTVSLLEQTAVYIVPAVNWDGYAAIGQGYSYNGRLQMIRKNRHFVNGQEKCASSEIGVDLNRNYPHKFALDDNGSSGALHECWDDFRGLEGASEPEVQAMIAFTDRVNLKVAVNLHAYGNLFITPFNYADATNSRLHMGYKSADDFYDLVWEQMPPGNLKGNGATTVGYTANGEASDWFLGEKGIIAMSPELGTNDSRSNTFFIQ